MGCDEIFGKSMMKNAQFLRVSFLLQFAAEMWTLSGSIVSIQSTKTKERKKETHQT